MLSDGTNTYQWDAENRLIQINYPGSGNYSLLIYDSWGHNVEISEYRSSSILSATQFLWADGARAEKRDASGNIVSQFFSRGQTISGANFFYTKDHLRSIRELTDSSGTLEASYSYDLYGNRAGVSTGADADFQFAGYYYHKSSQLSLPVYRAYDSRLSRWLNRDPLGENGGLNLYAYTRNNPVSNRDPSGLFGEGTVLGSILEPGGGTVIGLAVDGLILVGSGCLATSLWQKLRNLGQQIGDYVKNQNPKKDCDALAKAKYYKTLEKIDEAFPPELQDSLATGYENRRAQLRGEAWIEYQADDANCKLGIYPGPSITLTNLRL
jgi:RHS repeat-associated protein